MHGDQIEGSVRERKRMEWGNLKFRLWNTAAREVDRLVRKIDPRDSPEEAGAGRPAKITSGTASGIQQPRAGLKATAEQSRFDGAGAPVPPVALVRSMDSLVVVDGDAGGQCGRFHLSKCISGLRGWLPSSG